MKKVNGCIVYRGKSLINDQQIVVVALGFAEGSTNSKTGAMIQTYILVDGVSPVVANRLGIDESICGDCKHRGIPSNDANIKTASRSCYVNLAHGPSAVYRSMITGKYSTATPETIRSLCASRKIRLGTYGDPNAVPYTVWENMLADADGWTGYTHHKPKNKAQAIWSAKNLMSSADSIDDAKSSIIKGQRYFRVIPIKDYQNNPSNALIQGEILCPASKEAGQRVQCKNCMLCSGASIKAKNIAIVSHGIGGKYA
jgi:hypothetical protein